MSIAKLQGVSILHIITRLDRGGSADVVMDLAAALKADGVRSGIVYGMTADPREMPEEYAARTGVDLYSVPCLVRQISPLKDLRGFFVLFRLIRRIRPDIVHTHTSKAGILGRFAAWAAGVKTIVHTPHGHIFYGYFNAFTTRVFILIERLAAKTADIITVLTESGRDDHLSRGIGKMDQFVVVPSCVDIRRFSEGNGARIREELGWHDTFVVGWAGRLVPIKDCGSFIKAAAIIHNAYPDIRFLVAGDGEEREKLLTDCNKENLDDYLVFLGERSDIPDIMAALDVFVLSSINEGFGRVLIEAMAAGAAIVSTDVGGTAAVVENGISGLLIPPSNPSALADAVIGLKHDGVLRQNMIRNGKRRALQFDTRSVIAQFEELYGMLLES